jgi:hypothetical protein
LRAQLVVIAALVAGCGGAVTPPPVTMPPAATPERPTPRASVEPTQTTRPAVALPAPVVELEAGTYLKEGFDPRVTFTIAEGWTAAQATAGFFDIQDDPGSVDVVAVQFGNVTEADTAEEVAANVAARPDLTVSEPDEVTIGGYTGVHLVVDTTDPLETSPVVFRPVIRLTPGDVSIASARRLDLNLLDVDGQVLAIMVGGSVAEWDHAMELATPVIESVQIGD